MVLLPSVTTQRWLEAVERLTDDFPKKIVSIAMLDSTLHGIIECGDDAHVVNNG
jgi:hypothetical protein